MPTDRKTKKETKPQKIDVKQQIEELIENGALYPNSLYEIGEIGSEIYRLERELSFLSVRNLNGEAVVLRAGKPMSPGDFQNLVTDLQYALSELQEGFDKVRSDVEGIEEVVKEAVA